MKKLAFNVSCLISAGDAEFVAKIGSFGHEVNTQRIQADLSIEVDERSEVIKTKQLNCSKNLNFIGVN